MSFIDEVKKRAKQDIKTIVLPEIEDIRVLEATAQVIKEGYAKIILIGDKEKVKNKAKENDINIELVRYIENEIFPLYERFEEIKTSII